MKYVLTFLLISVIIILGFGFYTKNYENVHNGEIIIGIGVLIIAFVLMPLFVFHRYKNKDLSSFKFKTHIEEETKKED